MSLKVAALYQFVALPNFREIREPLHANCIALGIKGTLLLANEGINGTIAGSDENIDTLIADLRDGPLFGQRLDNLELKFSRAAAMPFGRMKVRLKKEIVTLGEPRIDPTRQVGAYVDAADWNALIADPDVIVIDTRNAFEVAMGTFDGAVDPKLGRFSDFRRFTAEKLDKNTHRKVAMFCTGGIRCEKASAYLLEQGFDKVYHLRGGILKYLETISPGESRWRGDCFVFDERVALGHGLVTAEPARDDTDD
ncbi:MAG: rhodanese-related sulfurtransferase [Pseudomonadota bacterium]